MIDQTTVKLGGEGRETEYVIQRLPATRGMEVGIHLMQIVMGAAEGVGNIREGEDFLDAEYNPAQMAAGLMKRIDEKSSPAFIKALIRESLVYPDPGESFNDWYENHFAANFNEIFDLLSAIISHNGYADLVKKRMEEVMGIFSVFDGRDGESTPSSGDQS